MNNIPCLENQAYHKQASDREIVKNGLAIPIVLLVSGLLTILHCMYIVSTGYKSVFLLLPLLSAVLCLYIGSVQITKYREAKS
jgi:hypothetical protein